MCMFMRTIGNSMNSTTVTCMYMREAFRTNQNLPRCEQQEAVQHAQGLQKEEERNCGKSYIIEVKVGFTLKGINFTFSVCPLYERNCRE